MLFRLSAKNQTEYGETDENQTMHENEPNELIWMQQSRPLTKTKTRLCLSLDSDVLQMIANVLLLLKTLARYHMALISLYIAWNRIRESLAYTQRVRERERVDET